MANDMSKSVKINEFKSKGVDWCASKLYDARKENEALRASEHRHQIELYQSRHEKDEVNTLKTINNRMAQLLIENGIRPVRLRITYRDRDCEHCENYDDRDDINFDCMGCGQEYSDGRVYYNNEIITTTTEPFYSYELSGNKLAGITGLFQSKNYNVVKVVDLNTNDVLFEEKEEEE